MRSLRDWSGYLDPVAVAEEVLNAAHDVVFPSGGRASFLPQDSSERVLEAAAAAYEKALDVEVASAAGARIVLRDLVVLRAADFVGAQLNGEEPRRAYEAIARMMPFFGFGRVSEDTIEQTVSEVDAAASADGKRAGRIGDAVLRKLLDGLAWSLSARRLEATRKAIAEGALRDYDPKDVAELAIERRTREDLESVVERFAELLSLPRPPLERVEDVLTLVDANARGGSAPEKRARMEMDLHADRLRRLADALESSAKRLREQAEDIDAEANSRSPDRSLQPHVSHR